MIDTLQQLNWRYATKQYDTSKKLTDEQRHLLMETMRLAPSSFGLQPWKFIHVTTPEVRQKLREAAWGQPQVTDAAEFFVVASKTSMDQAYVDHFVQVAAETQGKSIDELKGLHDMISGSVQARQSMIAEWNARQVYIPVGFVLAVAAQHGIDAGAMEGFDPQKFDEILGLKEQGLTSRVLLGFGFRSPDDKYQYAKKVRFPAAEVFIER